MKAPCMNCKDRWLNTETMKRCHDSCEKYAEYNNFRKGIRKNNRAKNEYNDAKRDRMRGKY